MLLSETQGARVVHLGQSTGSLRVAAHQDDGPSLGELAVDPLRVRSPAHDVDRVLHGPAHGTHGVEPVQPGERCVRRGEQRGAPAAVAARRAEARHLALEHDGAQRRIGESERVRGPQTGEPAADDADVDVEVLGERGARRERGRDGLPPQREALVARDGSWRYIRRHASPSTSRSVDAMKSISSWPQMRGGDS